MNICKKIFAGILITSNFVSYCVQPEVTPYFSIRSQGLNTPRNLAGAVQQVYAVNRNTLYGTFSAALEYTRSFDPKEITRCLFGTESCPTIIISGSQVPDRGECDWLADYFYLPTNFQSTINFQPVIDNLLVDFNFYISLDDWTPGLYLALYAPLVHSRWNLNFCETIDAKGTSSYAPGYFTPNTLQQNDLFNSFEDFVTGGQIGPFTQTIGNTTTIPPITFQRLNNARMSTCSRNQTRLADIRIDFGYDFLRGDSYHMGVGMYNALPTGNRPEGEYLFEPIIGNGHHWELGATAHGHYAFYQSEDHGKQIIWYNKAIISHLFAAHQRRTFDLADKPFSRYMTMERMNSPIINNLKGDGVKPSQQFVNEFAPVANFSNMSVDVSATIQIELTTLLTFVCNNFSWDIGYNFWFRSCEKLNLRRFNPFEKNTKWALKGDSYVFGYDRSGGGPEPLVGAVALSATQSTATITSGNNFTADRSLAEGMLNPGIDNPKNATGDATGGAANNPLSADPFATTDQIQTSVNPILLDVFSVQVCSPVTRGMSNKFFTDLGYVWQERTLWKPYINIGGEVEFNHSNKDCDTCSSCMTCALSQWGVWFKVGITF